MTSCIFPLRVVFKMDTTASTVPYGCLVRSWIAFVWKSYLLFRQYRKYRDTTELPQEIRDMINEETFHKSRSYSLDKARFKFISDAWIQAAITATLVFGVLPTMWNISGSLAQSLCLSFEVLNEMYQSMIFLLITVALISIVNLPSELYRTFVVEETHGFNKKTLGIFIVDIIKDLLAVGTILGLPMLAGVLFLWDISDKERHQLELHIRELLAWGGNSIYVFFWISLLIVIIIIVLILLENVVPQSWKTLPTGELKTKIEALAGRLEFPLESLYVVEESKRSTHSNAYFLGLWRHKRIVLYDTILELNYSLDKSSEQESINTADDKKTTERETLGLNDDEVVAVIGHELGHWKLNWLHNHRAIKYVVMFLPAFLPLLYKPSIIYSAFGFTDTHPTIIGLTIIFLFVIPPYKEIVCNPIVAAFTRRTEFAADAFSAELGYSKSLQSALIKLTKDNLFFPVHDWLYSTWYQSHPSVPERIAALKRFE